MAQDWRTLKLEVLAETGQFLKGMSQANAKTESFGDKIKDFGKKAALAFGAAAAAAGAYAGKLIVDGVKAAVADTAAQERLAQALKATTGATQKQIAEVEKSINKMSLATGVADDNLRPAFQRLAAATGDVEKSQKGLQLALDISARTGKDVETVANALGKAYEGNLGSLGRLGVGMSSAEMKALGLEGTIAKLSETFGGAAATQAGTFEGKIAVLKNRFDEAKESIGMAFLPILDSLLTKVNESIIPAVERFASSFGGEGGLGEKIQNFVSDVKEFLNPILEAVKGAFEQVVKAIKDNKSNFEDVLDFFKELYSFFKKYILPILEQQLITAIKGIGLAFSAMIKVVAPIIGALSDLLSGLLKLIDRVVGGIKNLLGMGGSLGGTTNLGNRPFGGASFNSIGSNTGGNFTNASNVTVNVNSPSIIDEQGFVRSIVSAFNNIERTQGSGASAFQYV